jgi:hypothetical protein
MMMIFSDTRFPLGKYCLVKVGLRRLGTREALKFALSVKSMLFHILLAYTYSDLR